ncbi:MULTISPECIES: hypothetical protein [Serratia]|uniref:hypothetical protein n=1 Tax=Serratia TaxID=613 RepID=UPI00313C4888
MSKLFFALIAMAVLASCDNKPRCDSNNPKCMFYTPPAEVQQRYFSECMQLVALNTGFTSNDSGVNSCKSYAFSMASQEALDTIRFTNKNYQENNEVGYGQ